MGLISRVSSRTYRAPKFQKMGFERFDIYRKIPKDLTQPTQAGAAISICSCVFMVFLLLSEFITFIQVETVTELYVDDPNTGIGPVSKIPVRIDFKIPNMGCQFLGVDIQDEMGRHEVGFSKNTNKIPTNGGKGCIFQTNIHIAKVPGNFHVSTHASQIQPDDPDMAHEITDLYFGTQVVSAKGLPHTVSLKQFNALRGHKTAQSVQKGSSFDYTLRIVPTVIDKSNGQRITTYQYTYAHKDFLSFAHGRRMSPTAWFRYEISPLTVKYTEKRQPFYKFITTICAVVGGTFTVAGIIDSMVFTAQNIVKKAQMGKLS